MPWILCLRNSSFFPPFKGDIEHQHGAGYSGEHDKIPAAMSEPEADSEWTIRYRMGGWWMKWRCHCTQQGQGRPLWCWSWDLSKGGTETTKEKVPGHRGSKCKGLRQEPVCWAWERARGRCGGSRGCQVQRGWRLGESVSQRPITCRAPWGFVSLQNKGLFHITNVFKWPFYSLVIKTCR